MRIIGKIKIKRKITPYLQAIPEIILYEAVSKMILVLLVFLLEKLMMWAIYKTGRVAVSSGDFVFIFKSPYGWIAILTALIMCGVYIAFDINVIVNYAGEKVKERPTVLWKIVLESLTEAARFFTPGGLLVLFYATIIAPVIGVGMSISLTKNLYVPNFISSVINSNMLYSILYRAFVVIMVIIGVLGMFTIHGMVIDHISPVKSYFMSARMVIKNLKDLVVQLFMFFFKYSLVSTVIFLSAVLVPALTGLFTSLISESSGRFCAIAMILFASIVLFASMSLLLPLLTMKLTQLYYQYYDNIPMALRTHPMDNIKQMAIVIFCAYLLCWGVTYVIKENFNTFFPPVKSADLIGHRGAGNEGGENTLSGISKAIDLGCYGTEIDIQRTSDGYYVLNHDNTFKRVAGDPRSPSEMTLEQIKALKLTDAPGETVPTIEEVLDVSKDRIVLFIELKGSTADQKMCDDMIALIRQRGMIDDCVLISLKYDLIEYIEQTAPEINTGYLAFITLGNVGELNCDYLGLEEEAATPAAINAAHENGRKVMVWTPNTANSQRKFLLSDADALITDNASQANDVFDQLCSRDDLERMMDSLLDYI